MLISKLDTRTVLNGDCPPKSGTRPAQADGRGESCAACEVFSAHADDAMIMQRVPRLGTLVTYRGS